LPWAISWLPAWSTLPTLLWCAVSSIMKAWQGGGTGETLRCKIGTSGIHRICYQTFWLMNCGFTLCCDSLRGGSAPSSLPLSQWRSLNMCPMWTHLSCAWGRSSGFVNTGPCFPNSFGRLQSFQIGPVLGENAAGVIRQKTAAI
jgi:hypothetical protein